MAAPCNDMFSFFRGSGPRRQGSRYLVASANMLGNSVRRPQFVRELSVASSECPATGGCDLLQQPALAEACARLETPPTPWLRPKIIRPAISVQKLCAKTKGTTPAHVPACYRDASKNASAKMGQPRQGRTSHCGWLGRAELEADQPLKLLVNKPNTLNPRAPRA